MMKSMYYVIPFNKDKIRLVKDRFEIDRENPTFVNFTSRGSGGTLSKINPLVVTEETVILNLIFLILHFHSYQMV